MVLPSACVTEMVEMVIGVMMAGSSPRSGAGLPAALLTMMTAIAPAFCASSVLDLMLHVPRSMTAICPVKKPAGTARSRP